MTRLEYMNKFGVQGAELGLISGAKLDFYVRYSVYVNYLKDGKKHIEAVKQTSEDCSCDITCVYKAIYFFRKESSFLKVARITT